MISARIEAFLTWSHRAYPTTRVRVRLRPCSDPLDWGGYRNFPVVFQVLGEVDCGHTAFAEVAFDFVAVSEGGREAVEAVCHCVLAPLATH